MELEIATEQAFCDCGVVDKRSITDSLPSIGIPALAETPNYPGSNQRALSLKFERNLYPWQIVAIKNVLAGQKDTIVIAGTRSGKS
jgi:ATP-dependent helicase YprA (DUF1998 family)